VYYNHYSWLRSMENIFDVSAGGSHTPIPGGAGSISGGLDERGHIGYAAQDGLRGFGTDVFSNPSGRPPGGGSATAYIEGGMPLGGLALLGGCFLGIRWRNRQKRRAAAA
jgi:hypothetical protein